MAHDQMILAIGYWKNILYLHRKNESTAYDPLRNKTIRERVNDIRNLVDEIRSEIETGHSNGTR